MSFGTENQELTIDLDNIVKLNEFGQVNVDQTFNIRNDNSMPNEINELKLFLPESYNEHIVAYSVDAPVEMELSLTKTELEDTFRGPMNVLEISLKAKDSLKIDSNEKVTVNFELVLNNITKRVLPDYYTYPVSLTPASNYPLNSVETKIIGPLALTYANVTGGFEISKNGFEETVVYGESSGKNYNIKTYNYQEEIMYMIIRPGVDEFSLIEFSNAEKTLIIEESGAIKIREVFEMANYGLGTITSIEIKTYSNRTDTLKIVPFTEPPLQSPTKILLIGDRLDLTRVFSSKLPPLEKIKVSYEYELPREYINSNGNQIEINIPSESPVNNLFKDYKLKIEKPNSFKFETGSNTNIAQDITYDEQHNSEEIVVSVRTGLFWGTFKSFPVATLVFLTSALALFMKKEKIEHNEVLDKINKLEYIFNQKTLRVLAIQEGVKQSKIENMSSKEIENLKSQLNIDRARYHAAISDNRREIIEISEGHKSKLNQFNNIEQHCDRLISQLVNNYNLYMNKKIDVKTLNNKMKEIEKTLEARTRDAKPILDKIRIDAV